MKPAPYVVAASLAITVAVSAQTSFRSRVESVRLDALVTADGQPVLGLTADDFEVRDNGKLQKVTLLGSGSLPLDVILALDMSGSLTPDRLNALKAAGASLVKALTPDDRSALTTFNHAVTRRQPLTGDHERVRHALQGTEPAGATSLVDAMYTAIGMTASDDRRTLLIVFSDGVDTTSWLQPEAVIRAAERTETVIYAVSTAGTDQTPTMLRQVTASSGGKVLEVDSDRLASTFVQILEEFRQRYLLSYTLATPASPGWHRIEVRVRNRHASVKTRSGYRVPAR